MVTSVKTPVKIRIDSKTREAVKLLGRKGDSYDDVVRRLLNFWIKGMIPEAAAPIRELLGEE